MVDWSIRSRRRSLIVVNKIASIAGARSSLNRIAGEHLVVNTIANCYINQQLCPKTWHAARQFNEVFIR